MSTSISSIEGKIAHTRRALAHQARVLKPLGGRDAARLIALLRKLVELPP